jgi:thymidylate synthase (FAD)
MKIEFANGSVELLDTMPQRDLWREVVRSARVSYDNYESVREEKDDLRLLRYLIKHNHGSPLEMIDFKFKVKLDNMSVMQLLRHRISSLNSQSLRYTQADVDEFYVPEVWRMQHSKNKQSSEGTFSDQSMNEYFTKQFNDHIQCCIEKYEDALRFGIAREQARLFLPAYAVQVNFVWKINYRSLINFLKQRMESHAQQEIRSLAWSISDIVKEVDVILWQETIQPLLISNPSQYSR